MRDEPFIFQFHNPVGYFVYDINKNKVIEVRKQFYQALQDRLSNGGEEYKTFPEYAELKEEGYLSSKSPEKIWNPLSDYVHTYVGKYLNNLTLQVTQGCNLRCSYCYYSGDGSLTRKHNNVAMTWDIAKKTIDFFKEHSEESEDVTIGFYGGEPLLNFKLIRQCVDYANNVLIDKRINYTITTNGTVLNNEIISFLEKNRVHLLVSLDGPQEVHDSNRRYAHNGSGSFEKVYRNLVMLREMAPEYYKKIEINAVIENDCDYSGAKNFFEEDELFAGIKVNLNKVQDFLLNERYMDTPEFACAEKTDYLKSLLGQLSGYKGDVRRRDEISLLHLKNMFTETEGLPEIFHHNGPCIPGYEKLFVNIYGEFFPCVNASEKSEMMRFGTIFSGYDFERIEQLLNIGVLTEERCLNCPAMRICKICQNEIDNISELSTEIKHQKCNVTMYQFENYLNDYTVYKKIGVI